MSLLVDEIVGGTYEENGDTYTISREGARERVVDMLSEPPEGDDETAVDARILAMERQRDRAFAGVKEADTTLGVLGGFDFVVGDER